MFLKKKQHSVSTWCVTIFIRQVYFLEGISDSPFVTKNLRDRKGPPLLRNKRSCLGDACTTVLNIGNDLQNHDPENINTR